MHNLLIYRLIVLNGVAGSLLYWAYENGLVVPAFTADKSYMSYAIVALFVYGLIALGMRAIKTSLKLNAVKVRSDSNAFVAYHAYNSEKKLWAKFAHLDDIAVYLVNLGLAGTIVGFLMLFANIDVNNPNFSDALPGLQTAFYTSIVGITTWFWYAINLRMVKTALVCLIEDMKG